MSPELVIETLRQALLTALWVSMPLLIAGFIAGVVISLVQVVTSMQDSAFSTVPRLAAFFVALLVALPWMMSRMVSYTAALLGDLGRYGR